jgi:hypothetical protein
MTSPSPSGSNRFMTKLYIAYPNQKFIWYDGSIVQRHNWSGTPTVNIFGDGSIQYYIGGSLLKSIMPNGEIKGKER